MSKKELDLNIRNLLSSNQFISKDLKNFLDYISDLSIILTNTDRDEIYEFLLQKINVVLIQSFILNKTFQKICLIINEDENPDEKNKFFLESEPILKSFPSTIIILIKKVPYINCFDIKTIKQDLHIVNFSTEGNDSTIITQIKNYIQTTFNSLLKSYKEKLAHENAFSLKIITVDTLIYKIEDLSDLSNKTPKIPLELELVKEKIETIKEEKGKNASVDDLLEILNFNDKIRVSIIDFLNNIYFYINYDLEREVEHQEYHDTLEEINFWLFYENTLKNIKSQLEAPEVLMTLAIFKKENSFLFSHYFEYELKTIEEKIDYYIKKAESYNLLLKDLPIKAMNNSKNISELTEQIKKIFEVIRNKMKVNTYPVTYIYKLLEKINVDMTEHLLELLESNFKNYEDFIVLYKQCKQLFKNVWTSECESLRKGFEDLTTEENKIINVIQKCFAHDKLNQRLKDIKKYNAGYKKFIENVFCSARINDLENSEESRVLKHIQEAFKTASEISILDSGEKFYNAWKNYKIIVENEISNLFIYDFKRTRNINKQFTIIEKYNSILKVSYIQYFYQNIFIENIFKDLNDLKTKYKEGYQNSSDAKLCKIRGIPLFLGEIIWANQFKDKINSYRKKISIALGESWDQTKEGKKLEELIESFVPINSEKKIENWTKEYLDSKESVILKNEENENMFYFDGNYNNYKLKVNLESLKYHLFKNIKTNIPKNLIELNYALASDIQDALNTFYNICLKIKSEPKINMLIAQQKNDIHKLIKNNAKLAWTNTQKLTFFTKSIYKKVSSFDKQVTKLLLKIRQIDFLLEQISKSPLKKEQISQNIQSIQKLIDQIINCSNIEKWIKEIDLKLEKVLIKKLEECLYIWIKEFLAEKPRKEPILISNITFHKIKKENKAIFLEPSISEAREYWYNQLHQSMSIILNNKRLYFHGSSLNKHEDIFETTFRDILSKVDPILLLDVYSSLEKKIKDCKDYVKTWTLYQALWEIKPQRIYDRLGQDIEKWQHLINEIKQGRQVFDTFNNKKNFGAIIIDNRHIKREVSDKYDSLYKEIMNQFVQQTEKGMKELIQNISEKKNILVSNIIKDKFSDIFEFNIRKISKLSKYLDKWQIEIDKYKKIHGILINQKYKLSIDYFSKKINIEKKFNKFKQILKEKIGIIEEKILHIKKLDFYKKSSINERITKLEDYCIEKIINVANKPNKPSIIEVKEEELRQKIIELCQLRNLSPNNKFIDKILELYSILKEQQSVMIVGQSGTGKSAAWKILLESLEDLDNIKGESYIIDPKAFNREKLELFLKSTIRRIFHNQKGEISKRHWIIFDGDFHPQCVESLNPFLNECKVLTFSKEKCLKIPQNVRIIFEVENLKDANLANISRYSLVWFSEDIVTIYMMFNHYLKRLKQNNFNDSMNYISNRSEVSIEFENKNDNDINAQVRAKVVDSIKIFFEPKNLVEKALEILQEYNHEMGFTKVGVIESLFTLLRKGESNIIEYNDNHREFPMTDEQIFTYMSKWLIFSIIWGFGGSLCLEKRIHFSEKLKSLASNIEFPNVINFQMIDYYVNIEENKWSPWIEKVPNIDIDSSKVSDSDIVIPTADVVRHQEIFFCWICEHRPFILCGPPGSGKTMTLILFFKRLINYQKIFINFSSRPTLNLILKEFEHYCEYVESSNGTILRPKHYKYLIAFFDEINLKEMDNYNTQILIGFLRGITEQNGFWRPLDNTWITLERIQFVGACNINDVGRHCQNNRFFRYFPFLYLDLPGKDDLRQIYGTFNRAILRKNGDTLCNESEALTKSMIEFYLQCKEHYTPDIQPHYIYSPRELTRWKNAINESIDKVYNIDGLVRLWAHEALRLFQDRLVLDEEKAWCDQLVDKIAHQYFPFISSSALERPILFTNLLTNIYSSCEKDELIKKIEEKLKKFYEEELNIPLVIFDSALEHILRIDSILKKKKGHLLLVGPNGVGKTILSRFVAWMNGLTIFQINVEKYNDIYSFDVDLRGIMKRAGCKGEKICFIFDESIFLRPIFFERMNALLASGEIPGIFEGNEYISLLITARKYMSKDEKGNKTHEEIYQSFIERVKRNLHVIFKMNPLSPHFRNIMGVLYNRCFIDWFGDWSRESLFQVAKKFTQKCEYRKQNFKKQILSQDEMNNLIVDSITSYHIIVKELNDKLSKNCQKYNCYKPYITPRDFLDFINHFTILQNEKKKELKGQQIILNKGLQIIFQTEKKVNELKQSLLIKSEELDLKQEETKINFDNILEAQEQKRKNKKTLVEIEEKKNQIDKELAKFNYEIAELKKNLTDLEKIKQIKRDIFPNSIDITKRLKSKTENIKMVFKLAAIIYLKLAKKKVVEKCDWEETKKIIMKKDFISTIKNSKVEDLGEKVTNIIKKEIEDPSNKWNIDRIMKDFKDIGLLAEWIELTVTYADIKNLIETLKQQITELNELRDKYDNDNKFNEIIKETKTLEQRIEQLKIKYEKSVVELYTLKNNIEKDQKKIKNSENLLVNLNMEKYIWSKKLVDFKINKNNLLGDIFLASAFLAYIGFYDSFYRKYLKEKARKIITQNKIIYSNNFDEVNWLIKEHDKIKWQYYKLPNNNIFLENAIILQRCNRYPFIIDPTGEATEFIKRYYASKGIYIISFSDTYFLEIIKKALFFGYSILVQDVEKIDPKLNSLLNREIHKENGRNIIYIEDQEIDFSHSFNMFMIARDSSYNFTPDLFSRVTFLNFSITESYLQNKILDNILEFERPEVNKAIEDLINYQKYLKLQLREEEEEILTILNKESNLLENNEIIKRLVNIKRGSYLRSIKISQKEKNLKELELKTYEYAPLLNKISKIFFVLDTLDSINYFYKYTLSFFIDVLKDTINSKKMKEFPKKMNSEKQETLIILLFKEIYYRVGYSLLNQDKEIFAMRLAQINLGDKFSNEMNLLLKINLNKMNDEPNISPDLLKGKLTLNQRKQLSELNKSEPFKNIINEITSNSEEWYNFYINDYAENSVPVEFLHQYKEQITNQKDRKIFEDICTSILLLIFRPDRMMICINNLLKDIFDEEFVNIPELDLVKVIKEQTNCNLPILFCNTPCFDSSTKIETLSKQLNKKYFSLDASSSTKSYLIKDKLKNIIKSGEWLIINNIHLDYYWINYLEEALKENEPNANFRLFIIMKFNEKIPINILRIARKFIFELRFGIKQNLIASYINVIQSAKNENQSPEICRLHFLLAWFHAVIRERLKYIPIGWNKPYEFNEGELKSTLEEIDKWITKDRFIISPKKISMYAIREIIHQSAYERKIVNDYDKEIFESLVYLFFNEKAYEDNYPLFKTSNENKTNILTIPNKSNNAEYFEWINNLPNVEYPEWSGLPNNVEKLIRETASQRFISEINKIQDVNLILK